jgi:hypothetical protein
MKAALIKKAEGWYNLYQDKIGIGSTYPELQGYKLSKQNCDEIFGIVDVEKLADERFLGSDDITNYNLKFGFKEGFNKAMELNKDKQFTLEDLRTAMTYGIVQEGTGFVGIHSVDDLFNLILKKVSQPTEIEVEVEMEKVVDETKVVGAVKGVKGSGDKITTYKSVPKLDADGCIILKKAR